jgi:hypothetical protein
MMNGGTDFPDSSFSLRHSAFPVFQLHTRRETITNDKEELPVMSTT